MAREPADIGKPTVVNIVTNRVSRMMGSAETSRWLNVALFQGAPAKKGLKTLVRKVTFHLRGIVLTCFDTGYGRFRKPSIARERGARSNTVCNCV